ncbi:MAG: hypothetical protein M1817_000521 [Caeruleum heppii]|nr:MAG: hypothetical protein M1817_000521 [Caeruleum heppii]
MSPTRCLLPRSLRPIQPSRPIPTSLLTTPRRFSTTPSPQKHGEISTFLPASTPRLTTLLADLRTAIFIPAHLPSRHRTLIFRPSKKDSLLQDPITVSLSAAEPNYRLRPLNHLVDEPNVRKSLTEVLGLMQTKEDWANLVPLLIELKIAKRTLKPWQQEKILRVANEQGMQDVVVQVLRRPAKTGISMGDVRVAREAMWGARLRAVQGDWGKEATLAGLQHAEKVLRLMRDPEHMPLPSPPNASATTTTKTEEHNSEDADLPHTIHPRKNPEFLAVPLELAAALALHHPDTLGGRGSARQKVDVYLQRLTSHWPNISGDILGILTSSPSSSPPTSPPTPSSDAIAAANQTLQRYTPLLHAMQLATKLVRGTRWRDRRRWLKENIPAVREVVGKVRGEILEGVGEEKGGRLRGVRWAVVVEDQKGKEGEKEKKKEKKKREEVGKEGEKEKEGETGQKD